MSKLLGYTLLILIIFMWITNGVKAEGINRVTIHRITSASIERDVVKKRAEIVLKMIEENKRRNECTLNFEQWNPKLGKYVVIETPKYFEEKIQGYSCKDKQILTRLAYLESTWCQSLTTSLSSATGCYMFKPSTRDIECKEKRNLVKEEDCALWIAKNQVGWYGESIGANLYMFKDLL